MSFLKSISVFQCSLVTQCVCNQSGYNLPVHPALWAGLAIQYWKRDPRFFSGPQNQSNPNKQGKNLTWGPGQNTVVQHLSYHACNLLLLLVACSASKFLSKYSMLYNKLFSFQREKVHRKHTFKTIQNSSVVH